MAALDVSAATFVTLGGIVRLKSAHTDSYGRRDKPMLTAVAPLDRGRADRYGLELQQTSVALFESIDIVRGCLRHAVTALNALAVHVNVPVGRSFVDHGHVRRSANR